jgi:hypothetical protein
MFSTSCQYDVVVKDFSADITFHPTYITVQWTLFHRILQLECRSKSSNGAPPRNAINLVWNLSLGLPLMGKAVLPLPVRTAKKHSVRGQSPIVNIIEHILTLVQCSHRHPGSHLCPVPELPPSSKNAAGQKLLAKHFPLTSASPPSSSAPRAAKIPSDPKKRAQFQKVELMKLRHRAIPGDPKDKPSSVLVDQRLHVKVKFDDPSYTRREGMFWFRKVKPYSFLT